MVAIQNSEMLSNIIIASFLGQSHEESTPSAAGPGELDLGGVERLDEGAQGRLLGEPVQFHEEGRGRLSQGAGPVEEGPSERPGMGMGPGAAQPGAEPFDQIGRQGLGPGRPRQGGRAERRAVGAAGLGLAARHGIEVEVVHPDAVPLLVVLAVPELLDQAVGGRPVVIDI